MKYQELSHTLGVGERLVLAQHYASEQIKRESKELEGKWEEIRGVVKDRVGLLDLSVSFHESQEKVGIK